MDKWDVEGGCWPTHSQELLLRAALLEGQDAFLAWERWRSRTNIDDLDLGSQRMLPLLYRNLRAQGMVDLDMGKYKGVYRRTWYENQVLLHKASTVLTAFHDAGIETMILKGAALVVLYYKDYGLRPMMDLDVLVPPQQAREAIQLLQDEGWIPESKTPEALLSISNAVAFQSPHGKQAVDLHWHVLHEGRQSDSDKKFWEGAVSLKVGSVTTRTLNPSDQLLHAIIHGIKWNPVPPLRWVADSMVIINHSNSHFDWERLLYQAKKYRLILPVRDALQYLRATLEARIPENILKTLHNLRTTRMEKIEYQYKTQNYLQKPLGYLPIIWFDYSRLSGKAPVPQKIIGFVKYMRSYWGVRRLWQLPFFALFMVGRRMKAMMKADGK